MSLFADDNIAHSFTGVVEEVDDSVKISYNDLRIVNSKLIELEYEKQTNEKLRQVCRNDSSLLSMSYSRNTILNKELEKVKRERNVSFGVTIAAIILSIFLIAR